MDKRVSFFIMTLKNIFVMVLIMSSVFPGFVYAEEIDLAGMPFSELYDLKHKVEYEYNSRKEALPFALNEGKYVVGIDIAPGRYYVAHVEKSTHIMNPHLILYSDLSNYESQDINKSDRIYDSYFTLGDIPKSVVMEKDNLVLIDYGPLLFCLNEFNTMDYVHYDTPEGTHIPIGIYTVGKDGDIPVGKYQIFAGTALGGRIYVYLTKETYDSEKSYRHEKVDKEYYLEASKIPKGEGIILEEGNVLVVERDVVLNRQKELVFD